MPTARELLEQADALMRRNRMGSAAPDGAVRPATPGVNPPSVSPASGPAASPRTIQPEPIARSVAPISSPVDRDGSPAFAAPAPANEPPTPATRVIELASAAQTDVEAEFPVLTDAVDEAKAAAAAPLDDLADDVPLLTDAVEEIDVGIVDEAARGEPSFWELTARGETSVLGPAPDSIALVPLPEVVPPVVPQLPPRGRDPLGLDQPPAGYQPSETTSDEAGETVDRLDAIPPSGEVDAGDLAQPEAVDRLDAIPPSGEADAGDLAQPEAPGFAPTESYAASFTADSNIDESEYPAETSAAPPSYPLLAAASETEQQRIREVAEEIGMQVLQRIDIFTDTTLRARLAERMRPVVDRAAADLVAAINEHVGELVRAQISEAIEREIESWRRGR